MLIFASHNSPLANFLKKDIPLHVHSYQSGRGLLGVQYCQDLDISCSAIIDQPLCFQGPLCPGIVLNLYHSFFQKGKKTHDRSLVRNKLTNLFANICAGAELDIRELQQEDFSRRRRGEVCRRSQAKFNLLSTGAT